MPPFARMLGGEVRGPERQRRGPSTSPYSWHDPYQNRRNLPVSDVTATEAKTYVGAAKKGLVEPCDCNDINVTSLRRQGDYNERLLPQQGVRPLGRLRRCQSAARAVGNQKYRRPERRRGRRCVASSGGAEERGSGPAAGSRLRDSSGVSGRTGTIEPPGGNAIGGPG